MKTYTFKNANAPATIGQRVLLARLEHKPNNNQKLTMREVSKRIDYAQKNPQKFTAKNASKSKKVITLNINGKLVKAQLI